MAEEKSGKSKSGGKGTKRKKVNKPTSKRYTKYKIQGDTITRERSCPRCGAGIFLMKASNRMYCGKCHYTEFFKTAK